MAVVYRKDNDFLVVGDNSQPPPGYVIHPALPDRADALQYTYQFRRTETDHPVPIGHYAALHLDMTGALPCDYATQRRKRGRPRNPHSYRNDPRYRAVYKKLCRRRARAAWLEKQRRFWPSAKVYDALERLTREIIDLQRSLP